MTEFTRLSKTGKVVINRHATFNKAFEICSPFSLDNFDKFFKCCEDLISGEAKVSAAALSNVRGCWYEWLIGLHALKFSKEFQSSHLMLKLPNVSSFDCARLFNERIYNLIEDLRKKVQESQNVSLITSNPDFVIVKRDIIQLEFSEIISNGNVIDLDRVYMDLINKCDIDDIAGYAAVKTSLRPDRRLQIPHEGSLMKALYKHIQTRDWLIDAPGVKFFAFTQTFNASDKRALQTVATHSITDVSSKPQSAVDKIYQINSSDAAEKAFLETCCW